MNTEVKSFSGMMRSVANDRLFFSPRHIIDEMRSELGLQYFWELYRLASALDIMGRGDERRLPIHGGDDKQEITVNKVDRNDDDYLLYRLFCRLEGRKLSAEAYREMLRTSVERGLAYLYYNVGIGQGEYAEKDYRLIQKLLSEVKETSEKSYPVTPAQPAESIVLSLGRIGDTVQRVAINDRSLVPALNMAITGTSGSGKTYFAVNLMSQILSASEETRCVIIDPKGDIAEKYGSVLTKHGFTFYRLSLGREGGAGGVRNSLPISPFMFGQEKVEIVERLLAVFNEAIFQNNPVQQAKFRRAVHALLEENEPQHVTVEDLAEAYLNQQEGKDDKVSNFLLSLVNNRVFSGEAEAPLNFFSDNLVISYAPDLNPDIQGLVTNLTVTLFRDAHQGFSEGKPEETYRHLNRLLFIDEAHNLSNMKSSGLKRLLREGRSFGLGLMLASQHVNHFNNLIKGADLREEVPIWFVLRQIINTQTQRTLESMLTISSNEDKRKFEKLVGRLQNDQESYLAITNLGNLHLRELPLKLGA